MGPVLLLAVIGVAAWLVSLWLHPYAACTSCRDRRGRNTGSTGKVWGRCRRCGGTGERRRVGARMVHRS